MICLALWYAGIVLLISRTQHGACNVATKSPCHTAAFAAPLLHGLGSKRLELLAEQKVGVVVLLQLGGLHRQRVLPFGGIRHVPQRLSCMQRALGKD